MFKEGQIVRSIRGHDADRFYMVVQVAGGRVFIADGRLRLLEKPKAKNPLHLRPTNTVLDPQAVQTDKKLREALKRFQGGMEPAED